MRRALRWLNLCGREAVQHKLKNGQKHQKCIFGPLDKKTHKLGMICTKYSLLFHFRFASITINLGPTFLSGALAANSESHLNKPSCPLIQGPFRHYVLNVLWIFINLLCVLLTMYHLYKLYKDLSRSNLEAVRVATLVTTMISVQSPERGLLDQAHESLTLLGPLHTI